MIWRRLGLPLAVAGLAAYGCAAGSTPLDTEGHGGGGHGGAGAGGDGQPSASGGMVCVPGKQETCPCPGGAQGAQACNADGTGFEPCACPSGTSSSSGAGGASSSASSSSASSSNASSVASSSSGAGGSGPEACPGQPLALVGGSATVDGNTSLNTDDLHGYCTDVSQENGGDVVYAVVAATTGPMTITVTPTGFSAVISVTTGTCDGQASRSCSWGVSVDATTTRTVNAVAGTKYYVFVDGWAFSGPFHMTITN